MGMVDFGDKALLGQSGVAADGMLLSVLEVSPDCVKLLTPAGNLSFMSQNGLCAMELDSFADVGGLYWPDLWPEDARPMLQQALGLAQEGNITSFVADCPTAAGTPKRWEVTLCPVLASDGTLKHVLSHSRDVTGQDAYPPTRVPIVRDS